MDAEEFKEEIIRRTREFHSRRFMHERITSTKHTAVVECGALPRTPVKGSILRRATENKYKELLDEIYGTVSKH